MDQAVRTLPDDIETLLEGSVEAGIFDSREEAIQHALRVYFETEGDVRLEAALQQYVAGEIGLDDAADLVGVSPVELAEIIREHDTTVDTGQPSTHG